MSIPEGYCEGCAELGRFYPCDCANKRLAKLQAENLELRLRLDVVTDVTPCDCDCCRRWYPEKWAMQTELEKAAERYGAAEAVCHLVSYGRDQGFDFGEATNAVIEAWAAAESKRMAPAQERDVVHVAQLEEES